MKNLLAITVSGQLRWLKEALKTLRDDLDVMVIDDASDEPVKGQLINLCAEKGCAWKTKVKPMGLTNSWNLAYQYLKQNGYDNCILVNDDVRFPVGFSVGLIEGLKEFDLVSPLSNEPGNIWDIEHSPACQNVRRYTDIEPTAKGNINKVQQVLSVRYRSTPFREVNFINGFCLAFSNSISKFVYDEQFLFNPANINTWNEYDLAERISKKGGKIGICKTSYVFHWKNKTFDNFDRGGVESGDFRNQLWR